MSIKAWRESPQETIVESVREQLEATVEAMKESWKDGDIATSKSLSSQMMQQAITLGYVMNKSNTMDVITRFEESILQQAFQDDNDWGDVVGHLETLIRLQMALGTMDGAYDRE